MTWRAAVGVGPKMALKFGEQKWRTIIFPKHFPIFSHEHAYLGVSRYPHFETEPSTTQKFRSQALRNSQDVFAGPGSADGSV